MKSIVLCIVFAALLAVALGQYSSCAIMDQDYFLWDVPINPLNASHEGFGTISASLCLDMEKSCSHSTDAPCSVCQYVHLSENSKEHHSYCIGLSSTQTYDVLDSTKYSDPGTMITMLGDRDYCPGNIQRTTKLAVLCGQTYTGLNFIDENPVCQYNMELWVKGSCGVTTNSLTPAWSIGAVTPNSIHFLIEDRYSFQFWQYSILLDGKVAYQGLDRSVRIDNLDAGHTYSVVVQTTPGPGAVSSLSSQSPTKQVTTLSTNIGAFHTVVVDGKGAGIAIGMVISFSILGALFGIYKFTKTDFFAEKFGGGSKGGSKGFSLMDAEKSNAFE